jgi:hypothetical protein
MIEKIISEQELIDLVETRGVGVYPFKNVIDEISDYVQSQLDGNIIPKERRVLVTTNGNVESEVFIIQIPETITSKFDWIDNLHIFIIVYNVENDTVITNLTGSGSTTVSKNQKIINISDKEKLSIGDIVINCYSVKRKLLPRTLYLNLYHEFNHDWDNYNRLKKPDGDGLYDIHKKLNYNLIVNNIQNKDKRISVYCDIFYRLWIKSEFNALVASVYGELQGMKSMNCNYQNDIKQTQAYKVYAELLCDVKYLANLDMDGWMFIAKNLNIDTNNLIKYKNFFIQKTRNKLADLFHRICRTASLQYENRYGNTDTLMRHVCVNIDKNILLEYGKINYLTWGYDLRKEEFDKELMLEETKKDFSEFYNRIK